jgi:hypothetical protein
MDEHKFYLAKVRWRNLSTESLSLRNSLPQVCNIFFKLKTGCKYANIITPWAFEITASGFLGSHIPDVELLPSYSTVILVNKTLIFAPLR